jgi:glycosyltransferase involved in cell wall biosynthesis
MSQPTSLPRVTIGLTCFNAGQTIGRALRSALGQDWPDIEVVVVDDASTDDSWDVVCNLAKEDHRIKVIRHAENGGPAAARNTILANASGSFIAFFDDDDESLPNRVRIQHAALTAYASDGGTELAACYASGVRRYPNGYELELQAIGSHPVIPVGEAVADYLLFNGRRDGLFYGGGTPTCALMARAATFNAVGGFDASFRRVEDADFAIRLALAGGHFIGCPERLFVQYATVGSDKTPLRNFEAELRLIDKHADYLTGKGRLGYARDWFRVRYLHFSGQRLRFLIALAAFLLKHPVSGLRHLLRSAPGRLTHERSMQEERASGA